MKRRRSLVIPAQDSQVLAKDRAVAYTVLALSMGTLGMKIASGLSYANQAIALDGENESAWSYQANLLREGAKLAGFENNQTQRTSYQQQADEALRRAGVL